MKVIEIGNGNKVEYQRDGDKYFFCKIIEKNKSEGWADMHFGSKIEKGEEEIIKKAKAMIKSKEMYIAKFPEDK